jgi:hypothetical protein
MAVGSAIITAGASLYGSKRNRDEQRRATTQANERADAQTQRALVNLQPGYEQAMQSQQRGYEQGMQSERRGFGQANRINQEALERAMMMRGSTFMPQMQAYERGNVAAQEANLAALPAMRAAILGGRMPEMMQARSLPVDQAALQGLINPQAMQLNQRRPMREGGMRGGMGQGGMGGGMRGGMRGGMQGGGMNNAMQGGMQGGMPQMDQMEMIRLMREQDQYFNG